MTSVGRVPNTNDCSIGNDRNIFFVDIKISISPANCCSYILHDENVAVMSIATPMLLAPATNKLILNALRSSVHLRSENLTLLVLLPHQLAPRQ